MIAGYVTDQVISWEQMRFSANQKVDPDSFKVWLNIRTNPHKLTMKQTFCCVKKKHHFCIQSLKNPTFLPATPHHVQSAMVLESRRVLMNTRGILGTHNGKM